MRTNNSQILLILLAIFLAVAVSVLCASIISLRSYTVLLVLVLLMFVLVIAGPYLVWDKVKDWNKWKALLAGSTYLGLSFALVSTVSALLTPRLGISSFREIVASSIVVGLVVFTLAFLFGSMSVVIGKILGKDQLPPKLFGK